MREHRRDVGREKRRVARVLVVDVVLAEAVTS